MLEEFGDIDDADAFKKRLGNMRRSMDMGKKREKVNDKVKDCMKHRLDKDIMATSVSESMAGTGFGAKKGRGRTGSQLKRQTGSDFGMIGGDQSPELRDGPVQIITTPDGQQVMVMPDGTISPAEVITSPEGQEMVKMPDGTLSPAVRTPVGTRSPVNAQSVKDLR